MVPAHSTWTTHIFTHLSCRLSVRTSCPNTVHTLYRPKSTVADADGNLYKFKHEVGAQWPSLLIEGLKRIAGRNRKAPVVSSRVHTQLVLVPVLFQLGLRVIGNLFLCRLLCSHCAFILYSLACPQFAWWPGFSSMLYAGTVILHNRYFLKYQIYI